MALLADKGADATKLRLIRPRTLWPFQDEAVLAAIGDAKRVVVVEMNAGQISMEVERVVAGKVPVTQLGRLNGELLSPSEIAAAVEEIARNV